MANHLCPDSADTGKILIAKMTRRHGKDRTFIVWGFARHIGEARKNSLLVEEARNLGRQMIESLKG